MRKRIRSLLNPHWVIAAAMAVTLAPGSAGASGAVVPAERLDLPNGLTVVVSEEPSLPFVTLLLLVDAGGSRDSAPRSGLANLTAQSLLLGTEGRSLSEINEMLDFMGSEINTQCGLDYAALSLQSLKKELDRTLELFTDILTRPSFPEEAVQREKRKILGEIESLKDDPTDYARRMFRMNLFQEGPYAMPVEGTLETVQGLTRDMAAEFYRTWYKPDNAVLVVAGDVTVREVREKMVPALSRWPKKAAQGKTAETRFFQGPQIVKEDRPITQANIVLGHGGIERGNPDYYALSVMNRILGGGGFSSRLMEAIRVQRGLAYSVNSRFITHKHPGSFQVVLQTSNSSAPEAVNLVLREMERMQEEPVSEEELETAKKYLIGNFPLQLDTQPSLALFLAHVAFYDLGLDYAEKYPSLIQAVSREDVREAARTYLHPNEYLVSVVGDLDEIEKAGGLGGKTKKALTRINSKK